MTWVSIDSGLTRRCSVNIPVVTPAVAGRLRPSTGPTPRSASCVTHALLDRQSSARRLARETVSAVISSVHGWWGGAVRAVKVLTDGSILTSPTLA